MKSEIGWDVAAKIYVSLILKSSKPLPKETAVKIARESIALAEIFDSEIR